MRGGVANNNVHTHNWRGFGERDHETKAKAQALFCSVHKMDQVVAYVKPLKEFMKDSKRLVQRCTMPDLKGKPFTPQYLTYPTSCYSALHVLGGFWFSHYVLSDQIFLSSKRPATV